MTQFDKWLVNQPEARVWLGDNLSRAILEFLPSVIAGALPLNIRRRGKPGLRLYLFRTEHVYEVAWGGNPDKPAEFNAAGLYIAPRRSFERWVEKRSGFSRLWDHHARLLLLKLRDLLMSQPL